LSFELFDVDAQGLIQHGLRQGDVPRELPFQGLRYYQLQQLWPR
jgi:hypothetical protein